MKRPRFLWRLGVAVFAVSIDSPDVNTARLRRLLELSRLSFPRLIQADCFGHAGTRPSLERGATVEDVWNTGFPEAGLCASGGFLALA